MSRAKVLATIGTRPELIKMAPVVNEICGRPDEFELRVLFTAQHREMLDQMAAFFDIPCHVDLNLMRADQQPGDLMARLLTSLTAVLLQEKPDIVLAQGDTTTVLATALACFYLKLPFGHVEAGLRTGDRDNPFPEEINRRLISQLALLHFAPTIRDRDALLTENVPESAIEVTGNTVVDAVLDVARRDITMPVQLAPNTVLILLTVHRRESFGPRLQAVFEAIADLAAARPDAAIVYPVHPNPHVRETAHRMLASAPNIRLIEPLAYGEFVALMKNATLILTDSGGIQEEAPSLNVPVLVLRDVTERQQAIESGTARLVGTDKGEILRNALELLDDPAARARMRTASNPFGDGKASERIANSIVRFVAARAAIEPAQAQNDDASP